jgi:DNA cross-link repair 1C protein
MPPGTPYHGFVHPYPIRVDAFSGGAGVPPAALHLLTHTHTDHTTGLSARGFAQPVVCSHDAKEMLLRHEAYKARELHDADDAEGARVRTYAHLKVDPVKRGGGEMAFHGSRDLLVSRACACDAALALTWGRDRIVSMSHLCTT